MTRTFNQEDQKERRQYLRNNLSFPEVKLWQYLRGSQLEGFKFRRQHGIGSFNVDFYCSSAKLVIEVDGNSHYQPGILEYDKDRTKYLEKMGLKVLRFTNIELEQNIEGVLEKIKESIHHP